MAQQPPAANPAPPPLAKRLPNPKGKLKDPFHEAARIPKGFRPPAQGCALARPARTALPWGKRPQKIPNRNAVVARVAIPPHETAATALRLCSCWNAKPKVASPTRQPWAGGRNPVGIAGRRLAGEGIPPSAGIGLRATAIRPPANAMASAPHAIGLPAYAIRSRPNAI